tara:strand:- start:1526 stop:1915 length:390 start_codon:yes stop_codon:yes gene_type:complete
MASSVTNIAGVLSAISYPVAFDSTSPVTISTIPANSQIVDVNIDIITAFDAGTTNTISVGKTGSAAAFVAATDAGTAGRASVATTGVYSAWEDVGTSDVVATATFAQTGTAATAGSAIVTIVYKTYSAQ